jgi:hypothetical protein
MGRVGSCRVAASKFLARVQPATRLGRVGFGDFSCNFRVMSDSVGFFLSSGENFGSCPTDRMVGSGFSDGLGRVYRVGQPMIRST